MDYIEVAMSGCAKITIEKTAYTIFEKSCIFIFCLYQITDVTQN
jgi:hypothetical protein